MNLPVSLVITFLFIILALTVVLSIMLHDSHLVEATLSQGFNQMPIISNNPQLKIEVVFKGLNSPTSMAFLGPNDILVLEKNNGTVKRIVNGTLFPTEHNVNVATEGGRGMLGINVAQSGNSSSPYVFLYFIELSGNKNLDAQTGGKAHLYRYELKGNMLTNKKLILDVSGERGVGNSSDEFHNGGKILIGPDQSIYLVVGELSGHHTTTMNLVDGDPPDGNSGILRVSYDGKPIKGANIIGDEDPLNKYFAYGIRNSFGMDFDPETGNLWDSENGPDYGDEINLVKPGFNSGYSIVHGIWYLNQTDFLTAEGVAPRKPEGLVDFEGKGKYSTPEFTWYESVGPTALKFLNSDKLGKEYENDIFVGDSRGNIYHFELNEKRTALSLSGALGDKVADTNAENKDIEFGSGFKTITDIQVGLDGYLYILSFYFGAIFRIVPTEGSAPLSSIINLLDEKQIWKPINDAIISKSDTNLSINVNTNNTMKMYHRAMLQTQINLTTSKPLLLNLDYTSQSLKGNATFLAEIIDKPKVSTRNNGKNILWTSYLHNTSGKTATETFLIPNEITNKPVELRFYVITEGKGQHVLTIKKANIAYQ